MEGLFVIKAVFEGLVYDPKGEPIKVAYVGSEPCYVLNDDGFLRYIPVGDVDWQVWEALTSQIIGQFIPGYAKLIKYSFFDPIS